MNDKSERKFLAAVFWGVILLGAGFMLYSSHSTCTSALAPAHKYCAD